MQLSPTAHAIVMLRSLVDATAPAPALGDVWLLNAALRLEGRRPALRASDWPADEPPTLSPAAARLARLAQLQADTRALWYGAGR